MEETEVYQGYIGHSVVRSAGCGTAMLNHSRVECGISFCTMLHGNRVCYANTA